MLTALYALLLSRVPIAFKKLTVCCALNPLIKPAGGDVNGPAGVPPVALGRLDAAS